MILENISHTTEPAQPSSCEEPKTKKWSFDEGPCPCTNGSMKGKINNKSSKNESTAAVDVYASKSDYGESNKDVGNGNEGEGDRY